MRFTPSLSVSLPDPRADAVKRNVDQQIQELQSLPLASAVVIPGVALAPGVDTPIPHKLGRAPVGYALSAVRSTSALTPGIIIEYRDSFPTSGAPIDRSKILVLAAFSYGATVTVDVTVW